MKRIILFSSLILICLVLNARVLKVGIYENKPLVYIDDTKKPKGLFVDVLKNIAEKENWEIEYIYQSWADCLRLLEKDSIDILVDIAYTEKRTEIFDFNKENVFVNWGIVYVNDQSISTMLDLNRKTIAGVKDDLYFEELMLLLKKFDIVFDHVYVSEYAEGLKLIEEKKVDAAVVNRLFGSLNESNYHIQKSEIIFRPSELRFAAPKYKMQNILNTIDYHIKEMKLDENSIYYQSINEHISGIKTDQKKHNNQKKEYIIIIILTFTSIIFCLAFIYLFFKRKDQKSKDIQIAEFKQDYPYPYLVFDENFDVLKSNQAFKQQFNFIGNTEHLNLQDFTEQYPELIDNNQSSFKRIKIKNSSIKMELSILISKDLNQKNQYNMFFLDNIIMINSLSECYTDNNLLTDVFINLPDIHLLFNEDGAILKVNNRFLDLINETDNQNILPKNIIDLFNPGIISLIKNHFTDNSTPFIHEAELTINSLKNNQVKIVVNNFINNFESYYVLTISNIYNQCIDVNYVGKMISDIPFPVLIAQNGSKILFANSMFCNVFEVSNDEISEKKLLDLFTKNSEQNWIDQDFVWTETNVGIHGENDRKLQVLKIDIQIDALRKINILIFRETFDFNMSFKQYLSQLKDFNAILATNSDFIIITNNKKEVLYVSSSLNMLNGFETIKITHNLEILKQLSTSEDYLDLIDYLFNEKPDLKNQTKIIRFNDCKNMEHYFEIRILNTEIQSHQINYIICHEVSHFKKEMTQLNNRIVELHDLLNHMNDMLISVNQYGEILYSNLYFIEKSGFKQEEIVGKSVFDLIHISNHEGISNDLLLHSEFNKSVLIHDCRIEFQKTTNRILEHMSVSLTKFKDKEGKIFITIMIKDLSYIIKMQKELLKLKNLEILQKSSLHIANDFNNILTAIMGHIALLKLNSNIPDAMLDRINKAEEASIKAKELTQKIFPLEQNSHVIKDYYSIQSLLDSFENYKPDNIYIEIEIPDEIAPVFVAKDMTISAISKIMENAYESMPGGGIVNIVVTETEMVNNNIYSLLPGNYVNIKICDKGNGIDKIYFEKVFEPYFSLKNKEGLGLTQAFHQLISQNAYAKISSAHEKGTCVEVILPQKPTAQHVSDSNRHFNHTIKILFMDDEQLVLDIAQEYLTKLGFQVVITKKGEEVMQVMERDHEFDVIILDLVVAEGMGAKETIRQIREKYPEQVVFLSTGLKTELTLMDYRKYGFNDVIEKPIDFLLLKEKIYQVIK